MVIAGVATAGIPWARDLATKLHSNYVYVRPDKKEHGLGSQIEGIDPKKTLEGRKVLLVEDLISTGGSSIKAIEAIREKDGDCRDCFSIFDYGLKEAKDNFGRLSPRCNVFSLANYDLLLDVAKRKGYINAEQEKTLMGWRQDPFNWGEQNGFPKVKK